MPNAATADPALTAFLRAASQRPFSWGEFDCLQWLGFWIVIRRGVDPGANWRGTYNTPLQAARIIKRRGGMVRHLDLCLLPFGIVRTDAPKPGDVAVVERPEGETGAIVIGSMVATFADRRIFYSRWPVLAAWGI